MIHCIKYAIIPGNKGQWKLVFLHILCSDSYYKLKTLCYNLPAVAIATMLILCDIGISRFLAIQYPTRQELKMQNTSVVIFNLIQNGGKERPALTSFSTVTSTNVEISPKNILTFSFNPFATLV